MRFPRVSMRFGLSEAEEGKLAFVQYMECIGPVKKSDNRLKCVCPRMEYCR